VPGLAGSVPRIQIVTIAEAMELRDRALRQDSFKRTAREEDGGRQGAMDLRGEVVRHECAPYTDGDVLHLLFNGCAAQRWITPFPRPAG
jgi:hypothetical protein